MNRAQTIVDAILGAPAPMAPPKPTTRPTTRPTTPATPGKPRPGTRPWNPTVRPGVTPRPKARKEKDHGWVEDEQMSFAEAASRKDKWTVRIGKLNQGIKKAASRIKELPTIPGMRKHTAAKGKTPFAEAEGNAVPVPPPPHEENPMEQPTPAPMQSLCDIIRPGDRITLQVPAGMGRHGQEWKSVTGRAVMRNQQQGCWVVNLGGPHGRPGIADEENTVSVRRGGRVIYGK